MITAGQKLRAVRERLGLTIREVEQASERIAADRENDEYVLTLSRLSDIETKGVLPSIFRVYSLATIYRVDMNEVLGLYGIRQDFVRQDSLLLQPPKTHRIDVRDLLGGHAKVPVALDPKFDLRTTANMGRMIQRWGVVPIVFLEQFTEGDYTYGYIGSKDFTMYPLLMPGSFIRVDEGKDRVVEGGWRSEHERPIYFVETREGFLCCWCAVRGHQIILQPHPLSPCAPRMMKYPQDAEVIGQVVGVAMSLDWRHEETNGQRSSLLA